jgi:hypothetical protein
MWIDVVGHQLLAVVLAADCGVDVADAVEAPSRLAHVSLVCRIWLVSRLIFKFLHLFLLSFLILQPSHFLNILSIK